VELIPKLNEEELNRLRDKIGAKRKTRSDYTSIVKSVKDRLEEYGVITAREAHELGYTDTLLPSSTFRRCIINKIDMDIEVEKTSRDVGGIENLYYVRGMREGTKSISTVSDVAADIVSKIDKSVSSHDLSTYIDNRVYPLLKDKKNLKSLRAELLPLMAKHGYECVSSRLDFRRYA
jgi:hypothetical protein